MTVTLIRPMVSVCVPAYRADAYLAEAIESVLAQSLQDWELVVVDNASPDRTGEIARSYDDARIRVHTNDRTIPLQDNWNLAVGLATGRYLKLLPADDLLRPGCLAEQVKVLEADQDVALVACRRDFIDDTGAVVLRSRGLSGLLGELTGDEVVRRVLRSGINPIGEPAALLCRRDHLRATTGFDPSLLFPMDLELALRLLRDGTFRGLDDALAAFRVRGDSVSARAAWSQGVEHRRLLRRIAADDRWAVRRAELWFGLASTYPAVAKRRLLFGAVTQPWRPLRRLPAMVVGPTTSP